MSSTSNNQLFPQLSPSAQTPPQKELYDTFVNVLEKNDRKDEVFKMKAEDGSLLGPFNMLLYNPSVALPWVNLNMSIIPLLTPREREICIQAVLAFSQSPWGLYAHTRIGLASPVEFSLPQIQTMREGKCPEDFADEEIVIYNFAKEVIESKGLLKAEGSGGWQEAKTVLGGEKVAGVVHTVGAGLYFGVLLNVSGIAGSVPVGDKVDP